MHGLLDATEPVNKAAAAAQANDRCWFQTWPGVVIPRLGVQGKVNDRWMPSQLLIPGYQLTLAVAGRSRRWVAISLAQLSTKFRRPNRSPNLVQTVRRLPSLNLSRLARSRRQNYSRNFSSSSPRNSCSRSAEQLSEDARFLRVCTRTASRLCWVCRKFSHCFLLLPPTPPQSSCLFAKWTFGANQVVQVSSDAYGVATENDISLKRHFWQPIKSGIWRLDVYPYCW